MSTEQKNLELERELVEMATSCIIMTEDGSDTEPGSLEDGELKNLVTTFEKTMSVRVESESLLNIELEKRKKELDLISLEMGEMHERIPQCYCLGCRMDEDDQEEHFDSTLPQPMIENMWEAFEGFKYNKLDMACNCFRPSIHLVMHIVLHARIVFNERKKFLEAECYHFDLNEYTGKKVYKYAHFPNWTNETFRCHVCDRDLSVEGQTCRHFFKDCKKCHDRLQLVTSKINFFNGLAAGFARLLNVLNGSVKHVCMTAQNLFPEYRTLEQNTRGIRDYNDVCCLRNNMSFLLTNGVNWHKFTELCLISTPCCKQCQSYVKSCIEHEKCLEQVITPTLPSVTFRSHACSKQYNMTIQGYSLKCIHCKMELIQKFSALFAPQFMPENYSKLLFFCNFIIERAALWTLSDYEDGQSLTRNLSCKSKNGTLPCIFNHFTRHESIVRADVMVCSGCIKDCKIEVVERTHPLDIFTVNHSPEAEPQKRNILDTAFIAFLYDSNVSKPLPETEHSQDFIEAQNRTVQTGLRKLGYFWKDNFEDGEKEEKQR